MYKRIKNKLGLITFLMLLCLLSVPTSPVYAYFSDSISEDVGIELALGSIDLAVKENSNRVVILENSQNKVQLKETIQNNGTLTGKLAYRVLFKDTNSKKIKSQSEYVVLTDSTNGSSLHLNPNESKEVSLNIDITSVQNQTENTEVQIEFLLFQTNGTIEKPLFNDKESLSYSLKLNKDPFWNNNEVIKVDNYSYAIELPEAFYFAKNGSYHASVNPGIVYLESDTVGTNWGKIIKFTDSSAFSYEIENIPNTNRAKVYFYLNRNISNKSFLNKAFYSDSTTFTLNGKARTIEYNANRLFLSSDNFNSENLEITENDINFRESNNKVVSLNYVDRNGNTMKVNSKTLKGISTAASIKITFFIFSKTILLSTDEDSNFELPVNDLLLNLDAWWSVSKPVLQITMTDYRNNKITLSNDLVSTTIKNVSISNTPNNSKQTMLSFQTKAASGKTTTSSEQVPAETRATPDSNIIPEDEEKNVPEGHQHEVAKEQIEEASDQAQQPEESLLPTEDQFKYIDLTFNEETYMIGFTQDQFDWLLNFKTIQEFSDQLTEETPPLYVKYDQVAGIEDIEQFVYQLAEEKQLDFEITLKNIPEHKLLEIKFTK